jgi:hypothetical protein
MPDWQAALHILFLISLMKSYFKLFYKKHRKIAARERKRFKPTARFFALPRYMLFQTLQAFGRHFSILDNNCYQARAMETADSARPQFPSLQKLL